MELSPQMKRRRGAFTIGCAWAAGIGLTGCSGVGDFTVETPDTTVSFTSGSASVAETGVASPVAVVLVTRLTETTSPITVDVFDAGSGTASVGSDYVAFGRQQVTFPAGSVTGAVETLELTTLGDSVAEGADETIALRLENVSGAVLSGLTSTTVSIADAETASVHFDQGTTLTADESSTSYAVDLELDLTTGATLGFDISLTVGDDRTGDATPGDDYAAITPVALSFPAGSADGSMRTVNVQVIDDAALEGVEFLALSLAGASLTELGGVGAMRHVLTITDDESPPDPAFVASSGATGTETTHASGDSIDLGTQLNGGGPNLGTLLRISNQGGGAMELGQPILSGANGNDFYIEVESTSQVPTSGLSAGLASKSEIFDLATPFMRRPAAMVDGEATPDPLPGIGLTLDEAAFDTLLVAQSVRLHGVPMPGMGDVTLQLERKDLPIANDAVLMVDGEPVAGGPRSLLTDLSLWSGSAVELPGSRVFLVMTPEGVNGKIELPFGEGRTVHLSTETPPTADSPAQVRLVREADLAAMPSAMRPPLCDGEQLVPGASINRTLQPALSFGPPLTSELVTTPNSRLAIETDFQLFDKFGSTSGVTDYVTGLIGAISDQYLTDIQCTLSIAYLGVYTTSADPWTTPDAPGGTAAMLDEFRNAWVNNGWPASADLAHFLSGASLGGGRAYVDVICSQTYGFGVSGNINGNINWGSWTGSPGGFTWDFVVVAHELGHNFGASHTHEYCPPIDQCSTNCTGPTPCSQGTIMSYCHSCGGMDNIDLNFHQQIANIMRGNVDSSCLGDASMQPGDFVRYRLRFNPESGVGARSATLRFDHNAPNAADPFELLLSGTSN